MNCDNRKKWLFLLCIGSSPSLTLTNHLVYRPDACKAHQQTTSINKPASLTQFVIASFKKPEQLNSHLFTQANSTDDITSIKEFDVCSIVPKHQYSQWIHTCFLATLVPLSYRLMICFQITVPGFWGCPWPADCSVDTLPFDVVCYVREAGFLGAVWKALSMFCPTHTYHRDYCS